MINYLAKSNIRKINNAMKRAALSSSKILMKSYNKKKIDAKEKTKKEWVTETDVAVEKIIIKELLNDYPNSNFMAEESGINISNENELTWIIDPIDGTNNFITKYPYFCISIAAYFNEEIIAGCIYNPLNNELFMASKNLGSTLNGKPYSVSEETKFSNLIYGTGFVISNPKSVRRNMKNLDKIIYNIKSFRRTGSAALDLANASCGRQHGYWQLLLRPWDYAAGVVLVREAGGIVTDIKGDKLTLDSDSLLASTNIKNHNKMIKILNS